MSAIGTSGAFGYGLMGYFDDGGDEPVDGLMYQNYPLKNCSILSMDFTQINQPTTQIQVYSSAEEG